MKIKKYTAAAAMAVMASCSSPERRSETETDTSRHTVVSDTVKQDSTASGTLKATGSMNDSNNSGVNSSDGAGQKTDKTKDDN
jgi:hypothetical protein